MLQSVLFIFFLESIHRMFWPTFQNWYQNGKNKKNSSRANGLFGECHGFCTSPVPFCIHLIVFVVYWKNVFLSGSILTMYVQTIHQYGLHVILDDPSRFCILLLFTTGQRSGITQITKKEKVRIFDDKSDHIFILFADISFKQNFGPSIRLSEILSWSGK